MRKFEKTLASIRADMFDMREEMQAMNRRLSHLEEAQAFKSQRLDRMTMPITCIEKRLDLVEA